MTTDQPERIHLGIFKKHLEFQGSGAGHYTLDEYEIREHTTIEGMAQADDCAEGDEQQWSARLVLNRADHDIEMYGTGHANTPQKALQEASENLFSAVESLAADFTRMTKEW
jgi:hypothetical protein